jgi:glycosyltransferase domain-containing protein
MNIEINKSLTLLIPLKGRHPHSERLFYFLKKFRLNYKIFLADGSDLALPKKYLKILDNAKIEYRYVRFKKDKNIKTFILKLSHSLELINTKYVMIFENDDLLVPFSVNQCLRKLEIDKTLVGCGGYKINFNFFEIQKKFKKYDNLYGNPVNISKIDTANNYIASTGLQRIEDFLTKSSSVNTFNDIFHTRFLRKNILKIKNLKFSYFWFYLRSIDILNIFKGKILKIDQPIIIHQHHPGSYGVSAPSVYDNLKNFKYLKEKSIFKNSVFKICKKKQVNSHLNEYFAKIKYIAGKKKNLKQKFFLINIFKNIYILRVFYQIIKNLFLYFLNIEINIFLKKYRNYILRIELQKIFNFLKNIN